MSFILYSCPFFLCCRHLSEITYDKYFATGNLFSLDFHSDPNWDTFSLLFLTEQYNWVSQGIKDHIFLQQNSIW